LSSQASWSKIGVKHRKQAMTKKDFIILIFFFAALIGIGGQGLCHEPTHRERIISRFNSKVPREWGERVRGVKTKLDTDQNVIALTFDACGGPRGSGYDAKLIEYLKSERIPATLFFSGKWIDANPEIFRQLAKEPFFEIGNHGLNHKPSSMNGRSAYGIAGTKSVGEIFDEIEQNATKIEILTGRKPKYYRPGTAHSDEVCVEIANALGYEVVNFSVRGDAGATYTKIHVKEALLNARPSSIVLMHLNHPEGEAGKGLIEVIPELKNRGFGFVKLSDCTLK
jgi:peptidoglycan/xylan/chitin deacetylase (PgdA/CDA1 family)